MTTVKVLKLVPQPGGACLASCTAAARCARRLQAAPSSQTELSWHGTHVACNFISNVRCEGVETAQRKLHGLRVGLVGAGEGHARGKTTAWMPQYKACVFDANAASVRDKQCAETTRLVDQHCPAGPRGTARRSAPGVAAAALLLLRHRQGAGKLPPQSLGQRRRHGVAHLQAEDRMSAVVKQSVEPAARV